MKKSIFVAGALAVTLASCGEKKVTAVKMKNAEDSLAYAIGVVLAENAIQMKETDSLDKNFIIAGFDNIVNDQNPQMRLEDAQKFAQNYFQNADRKKFENNIQEGLAFQQSFAQEEGVISTDSGILYKYINKSNSSEMVNPMGSVSCMYVGTFTDGVQFDASQEPVTFGVRQVIPGWTELLMLMHPGDKIKAVIPYDMAYGERGRNGIPPYSTLVFEMELIEIVK